MTKKSRFEHDAADAGSPDSLGGGAGWPDTSWHGWDESPQQNGAAAAGSPGLGAFDTSPIFFGTPPRARTPDSANSARPVTASPAAARPQGFAVRRLADEFEAAEGLANEPRTPVRASAIGVLKVPGAPIKRKARRSPLQDAGQAEAEANSALRV